MTEPSVPTGMKSGVCTKPCGVGKSPLRARPARAVMRKSNTRKIVEC